MFGYIRPVKDELKMREFEQFKTCYCALCHTLKSEYGWLSRFYLNYDFTFLTMLLWEASDYPEIKCARCIASPFKKKKYCAPVKALKDCAGYSVILAWWKLRDALQDEGFFGKLRARLYLILTARAYKKAAEKYPDFVVTVTEKLSRLNMLEKENSTSLDETADQFAAITAALAWELDDEARQRALEQLLYHTGRYIYILDAVNDLKEDQAAGRYNPVAKRFELQDDNLREEAKQTLDITLKHSISMIGLAYELITENVWAPITRNIIYLGMPEALKRVLSGTWNKKEDKKQ